MVIFFSCFQLPSKKGMPTVFTSHPLERRRRRSSPLKEMELRTRTLKSIMNLGMKLEGR